MGIAQENTRVPGAVLTPETASVSGAGRFAPSPSGDFHLGNLRTYTLAWIFARATGRRMLYRVEDIDRERSHDSAALDQMEDLASFGMDWDEDPVKQSDRFPLYDDVLAWLAKRGWVYECYCSRKDIREASRAPHATPGMYPGTCRNLTDEQRQEQRNKLAAQGRPPAIRFNAHAAYDAIVADGHATTNNRSTDNHTTPPRLWTIHEDFTTPPEHSEPHYDPASKDRPASTLSSVSTGYSGPVDDIVLRRGDGNWAYNLAVVVDDLTMGIDQITRGDDLLASAPGQNFLATVLEPWATDASHKTAIAPTRWRYNHVPLVVTREQMKGHETTDHQLKRLAKRDGAVTRYVSSATTQHGHGWHSPSATRSARRHPSCWTPSTSTRCPTTPSWDTSAIRLIDAHHFDNGVAVTKRNSLQQENSSRRTTPGVTVPTLSPSFTCMIYRPHSRIGQCRG